MSPCLLGCGSIPHLIRPIIPPLTTSVQIVITDFGHSAFGGTRLLSRHSVYNRKIKSLLSHKMVIFHLKWPSQTSKQNCNSNQDFYKSISSRLEGFTIFFSFLLEKDLFPQLNCSSYQLGAWLKRSRVNGWVHSGVQQHCLLHLTLFDLTFRIYKCCRLMDSMQSRELEFLVVIGDSYVTRKCFILFKTGQELAIATIRKLPK